MTLARVAGKWAAPVAGGCTAVCRRWLVKLPSVAASSIWPRFSGALAVPLGDLWDSGAPGLAGLQPQPTRHLEWRPTQVPVGAEASRGPGSGRSPTARSLAADVGTRDPQLRRTVARSCRRGAMAIWLIPALQMLLPRGFRPWFCKVCPFHTRRLQQNAPGSDSLIFLQWERPVAISATPAAAEWLGGRGRRPASDPGDDGFGRLSLSEAAWPIDEESSAEFERRSNSNVVEDL